MEPFTFFGLIAHILLLVAMANMVRNPMLKSYNLHSFIFRLIPIFTLNSISLLIWTVTSDGTFGLVRDFDSNIEQVARTISYAVGGLWFEFFLFLGVMFEHPYVSKLKHKSYSSVVIPCVIVSIVVSFLLGTGSFPYFMVNALASILLIEVVLHIQKDSRNLSNMLFCFLILFGMLASDFRVELASSELGIWERLRFSVGLFVYLTIIFLTIRTSGRDQKLFLGFLIGITFMYLLNSISPESVFGWGIARPLILMMILLATIPIEIEDELQSEKFILKLGLGSLITTPLLEITEVVLPFVSIISATLIALVVAITLSQTRLRFDASKYSFKDSILSQYRS